MSNKNSHLTTLSDFKDEHYGPRGTTKREALETGFESFKKEAAATVELADLFGAYRSKDPSYAKEITLYFDFTAKPAAIKAVGKR